MKRKTIITTAVIVGVIAAVLIYSLRSKADITRPLETDVRKVPFEIIVVVTGELQAQSSTEITAPMQLRSRNLRIRSIKIQDLIPEGTIVQKGDYVATLDRSEADNSYKDVLDNLEVSQSLYTKTMLDTTMQLRNLRDELVNLKFNMEESEITLEQSQFEPPATIRQARMNLDKAVLNNFVITAPAPGMVIYKREWSGQKRTVGSEISSWDLTVATLPDLSTMISKTYVNEIDISKIKKGQNVRIGVDAFPEKEFTGTVIEVANIGEQLPNTDAKVFEVVIILNGNDPILRPSMTTSNSIITKTFDDVMYLPLEAVHSNDSLTFVYTKKGNKQVVVLDESNENEIIVEQGLETGDKVYLSIPSETEKYNYTGLELAQVIRDKEAEKIRLEEEERARMERENEAMRALRRPPGDFDPSRMRGEMPEGFDPGAMRNRQSGGSDSTRTGSREGFDPSRMGGEGRGSRSQDAEQSGSPDSTAVKPSDQ